MLNFYPSPALKNFGTMLNVGNTETATGRNFFVKEARRPRMMITTNSDNHAVTSSSDSNALRLRDNSNSPHALNQRLR
jgi:hypothetical protein